MSNANVLKSVLTLILAVLAAACDAPADGVGPAPGIKVLSNRADLVSGGNALIELERVGDGYRVDVDGRDVTGSFAKRPDGRVTGLVEGLALGSNQLAVSEAGARATITVTNHPIGGPIFSGEQIQPWICGTEANGLGRAVDDQCNAPTVFEFFYRPVGVSEFRRYDPANPPADVATTTTDEGATVPYIVRLETGTQDRGIYRIAVLFDPAKPWQPWAPQSAWNRKLHYLFGHGCGAMYEQGAAPNVLHDLALSRGFMAASSSLNVLGTNCNTWTSAEAVMMLKEHIVERYGEIRYTMAEGGSGGAIGQHLVANNYPGLLQGIQPAAGAEDYWSINFEVVDCYLLLNYFDGAATSLWPDDADRAGVTGHANAGICKSWQPWFKWWMEPRDDPTGDAPCRYDAETNPRGCRSTINDFIVGILGRRPAEHWGESATAETRSAEAMSGGFALLPYDNQGVQYGLRALLEQQITAEQFVHLNEQIGAIDVDAHLVPGRRRADRGSEGVYRTGAVNDGGQLDEVAIVDLRPFIGEEDFHTAFHSHALRARLRQAHGHSDNHVLWSSTLDQYYGDVSARSFLMLDRWLEAIEADRSDAPLAAKITRNKPADAVDACFIGDRVVTDATECAAAYPVYGTPRVAAGSPVTHDIISCQLKPLDPADYPAVSFTPDQWSRLQATFAEGVCDYGKPALGRVASQPWMTYADGPGGWPLPEAPASIGG